MSNKAEPTQGDRQPDRREVRLVFVFAMLQFLLHVRQCVASGDPRLWPPHMVAFLHDLLLLGVAFSGAGMLRRSAPLRFRRGVGNFSMAILLILASFLALYPQLLREYLAFPVNIFGAGAGSIRVVLQEYLGLSRLWPVLLAVTLGIIAIFIPFRLSAPRRSVSVFWVLVAVPALLTLPRSPHPLLYSLQQSAMGLLTSGERVVPSLQRPLRDGVLSFPKAQSSIAIKETPVVDHIFLIVLEGVSASDFEREFLSMKQGFYAKVSNRATYFERYYATNLDSYTSLIAMLTSVQVPYRAYGDENLYAAVNQTNNLTRLLHRHGFFTAFVSTYEYQPFVPTRSDWDQVIDRRSLPSTDGWVSLGTSRMESATEDRSALSTVVGFAISHPGTFVLHELVYGHSTEWRAKVAQSQLGYYNTYLRELLEKLEKEGLTERSMLVIVSDHGERAKASSAENYRVPLLVVAPNLQVGRDTRFRSHLDLAGIVLSYLTGSALPSERTGLYVVGSSERWVYGDIDAHGASLFIDDQTGTVLSKQGNLQPSDLRNGFQSLLNDFDAQFGPSHLPVNSNVGIR